ncbi:MCE family protein [Nocardioides sp. WS12]|uniref:MCE family protein n=1 Tax=Nocardioides sp. WS12 TaxID=2486272 RepID=UPI0015FE411B|nr:MCE family protein [Nocardioides sp. WS12]
MTSTHRSRIPSSAYKLVAFGTITTVLIGVLATLIGNISFVDSRTYYALFSDATSVFKGDRVRLSGVEVGSVRGLEIVDGPNGTHLARVEFTVEDTVPIYADAQLQLRYENIVGQRYLSISESPEGQEKMADGGTFPASQTTPALNLTELFNGFQPLFRALEPKQLNDFSFQLVRALQGESTDLAAFMRDTGQLTNTIADRDAVIGDVVTNLNTVLETVGTRDGKLTALIVEFRDLMTGLSKNSDTIEAALPDLARLLAGTTDAIADVRGPLKKDVDSLKVLSGQLHDTRGDLEDSLNITPERLKVLTRAGSYGSWFNYYLCGLSAEVQLLNGAVTLGTPSVAVTDKNTVCAGGIEQ